MTFKITEKITSRQNPKIKNTLLLQKASERRKQNIFVIEGLKEIEKAARKGYEFDMVFFCSKLISAKELERILPENGALHIYEVSPEVFEKMAYRENSGGVVVLARPKNHRLENLKLRTNPLILVIESVEKPGNLGALYRTADAAGIDAVLICDPKTDLYNANAVRASLGCVFTIPTALTDSKTAIEFLKKNQIKIFATYLQAAVPYHTVDFTQSSAIVMGTEATGISQVWVDSAEKNIIIPMRGEADSMNVSTSAAVVIFEACRQRGFK
jgi:TrmH family RNA methyltransferase